jgi:hypothetical protein
MRTNLDVQVAFLIIIFSNTKYSVGYLLFSQWEYTAGNNIRWKNYGLIIHFLNRQFMFKLVLFIVYQYYFLFYVSYYSYIWSMSK